MEKDILIGIILIALSIHLIFNRKWIARKQEEWAKKQGGIFQKSYESRSQKDQEVMVAISGPLVLVAGIGFLFSDYLTNLQISQYILPLALVFVLAGLLGFVYTLVKARTKWNLLISAAFFAATIVFLFQVLST